MSCRDPRCERNRTLALAYLDEQIENAEEMAGALARSAKNRGEAPSPEYARWLQKTKELRAQRLEVERG